MFGGDLDKAIDSFRKATMIDPHDDEAFVWLAIAYRKKGDEIHSRAAVAEALRLNRRSVFAKRVQAGAAN
jgi:Flp pilus assembly protein TadD